MMATKRASLAALAKPKAEPAIPPPAPARGEEESVPLNFRVPASFRRAFKRWAVDHDMTQSRLLLDAFEAYTRGQRQ
jgi:hypothetical protein